MKKLTAILIGIMLICVGCGSGNSGATAEINVTGTEYVSSAVPGCGIVKFTFKDADGNEFTGLVNGLKSNVANGSGKEINDEAIAELVNNIGSHFAGGSSANIEECDAWDLIDAEKYGGKDNDSVSSGKPFGDANLCWAASTADMLVATGWANGMNEDEIMSYFTENFFDDGAYQETGIKFYINGVNMDQSAAEKGDVRDAVWVDNESSGGDVFASTQARDPGKNDGKINNIGKLNDYAAENYYESRNTTYLGAEGTAQRITDCLDNAGAAAINIVFYKDENTRVGSHALTVNGYIKNADGKLVALMIADPDNDIELGTAYADTVDATLEARQSRPNTYQMLLAEDFEHQGVNYISLKDYKFSNPKMKYKWAVIQQVITLDPATKCEPDNGGTHDACNTQDIVVKRGDELNFTGAVNESVNIPFGIANYSYKGYNLKDKPVAKCVFHIFKDGTKVNDLPFDVPFDGGSYTTGEANCSFSIDAGTKFDKPGEYTLDAEIIGVEAGGSILPEAFKGNNYIKNFAYVTVK